MVANWEILNKEFDNLIDTLSDEEWLNWHEQLDTQKASARMDLLLSAMIHSQKLLSNESDASLVYSGTQTSLENALRVTINTNKSNPCYAAIYAYALAA